MAAAPDGTIRIIEVKTGNADLSIRQSEVFPQFVMAAQFLEGRWLNVSVLFQASRSESKAIPMGFRLRS